MTHMTLAQFIPLAIKASVFFLVVALGLQTEKQDAVGLFRRPSLLLRSILAMNVAMVAVAMVIVRLFHPPMPIALALVALAIAPVPPILPRKQTKAGGSSNYAIGLLVAASLAAIVITPAAVILCGRAFGFITDISPGRVAAVVLVSVLVPLAIGIGIRIVSPKAAGSLARPVSLAAMVLLALAAVPILVHASEAVWAFVGNGLVLALVAFALAGLLIGHALGGPDARDRSVLALATATRHPGVAIAITSLNFPDEKGALAVILYHLVIATLVAIPYVRWRRRLAGVPAKDTRGA
jgi:BASS family bile acid:Na+ symporter